MQKHIDDFYKNIDGINTLVFTIAGCAVLFFTIWGLGQLIINGQNREYAFRTQCIESGMQYISNGCTR
jgi:hypothetical protein